MRNCISLFSFGIILFISCTQNNGNKNCRVDSTQTKINSHIVQKPIPYYKPAFEIQLGDYAYNYFFDSISNSFSVITDSVDAVQLMEDYYRSAEGDTNFTWGEHEKFTGYYLKKYCLEKDTFRLRNESVLKKYSQPLIINRRPVMSAVYINSVDSIKEFPFWSYDDSLNFHAYKPTTESFLTAEKLSGEKPEKVFADQLLDLNGDSLPERIIIYLSSDVNIIIAHQENGVWEMNQKIETTYVNPMQFLLSTIKFSNTDGRALVVKGFYPGNFLTDRNIEWLQIYIPR